MGYEAYQTLLLRQQNQLIYDQTNVLRSAAGLPPAAPLRAAGTSTRRTVLTDVERSRRDGYVVLAVMAALLLALIGLVGWGVVELVATLVG